MIVNYVAGDDAAKEVVQAIEAEGRKSLAILADVANELQVAEMFKQAVAAFGTLDILVANAGLQRDSGFVDMSLAQWNTVLNVNLTGQFLCIREAVREFLRRPIRQEVSVARGKIICMSSVHEVIPWGGHVNYATSKGGINMMMSPLPRNKRAKNPRVVEEPGVGAETKPQAKAAPAKARDNAPEESPAGAASTPAPGA